MTGVVGDTNKLNAGLTIYLGSYCHIAGSLLAFVDDMEVQGIESLKV